MSMKLPLKLALVIRPLQERFTSFHERSCLSTKRCLSIKGCQLIDHYKYNSNKHLSHRRMGEKQMREFRDVLEHCGLEDAGFRGLPWTYDNKQFGSRNVKVRLDRVVHTRAWTHLFPAAEVLHLVSPRSDHCPLVLQTVPKEQVAKRTL